MKALRNILCCIYLVATVCSLPFFVNMFDFPLTIGAGSWFYAFGLMMLPEEQKFFGILGFFWLCAFWVLLFISAILAYKGKFALLCVFSAGDALITVAYMILRLIWNLDAMEQTFILDGIFTVLFTAAMIATTVICRKKEMRTDVDEFLKDRAL